MAKEKILSYAQARELALSFSILNCQAKQWPFRWIGHTAMIYREQMTNTVWVYESTQTGDADGVRLVLFSDWLRDYPGKVWLRRCVIADGKLKRKSQAALRQHIKAYRGTPYPNLKSGKGLLLLIRAAWDSVLFKKASTNTDTEMNFFCTHLVAHAFRWASLVKRGYVAAEFEPDDTRQRGGKFDAWLIDDVELEEEVRIK